MFAMRRSTVTAYAGVVLMLVGLTAACARHDENSPSSNRNATEQANSNSGPSQGVPGAITASSGTPLVVQQLPPPPPKSPDGAVQPAAKSAADSAAVAKPTAAGVRAPKLVAPEKRMDFGKQPQDKNLVRAITIRNSGKADLKIESVVPS